VSTPLTFSLTRLYIPSPFARRLFFTLVISSPPGTNKPRCQCSCSYSSVTCRSFFRVRIGPEALQLSRLTHVVISRGRTRLRSAAAYIIFSGLDASTPPPPEPPPPPAQHQVHWKPGTNNPLLMGPLRLQKLSQADSSLESLAAIQGREKKHCYFLVRRSAAVINGLICFFPDSAQGIRCSHSSVRFSKVH
jgi:hypothetical protein